MLYTASAYTETGEASSVQLEEVLPEDDSRQRQSTGTGQTCCWTVFKCVQNLCWLMVKDG